MFAQRQVHPYFDSQWTNATSTSVGGPQSYADFSQGYTPVSATTEMATAQSYTIITGDTLRSIAASERSR